MATVSLLRRPDAASPAPSAFCLASACACETLEVCFGALGCRHRSRRAARRSSEAVPAASGPGTACSAWSCCMQGSKLLLVLAVVGIPLAPASAAASRSCSPAADSPTQGAWALRWPARLSCCRSPGWRGSRYPIRATMATNAMMTGMLFFSGDVCFWLLRDGCGRILDLARAWLVLPVDAVELHLLLADGEIAVVQLLRARCTGRRCNRS
jgi:hypothetical protein